MDDPEIPPRPALAHCDSRAFLTWPILNWPREDVFNLPYGNRMPEEVRFTGLRVDVETDLHDVILLHLPEVLPARQHPRSQYAPTVQIMLGGSCFTRDKDTIEDKPFPLTARTATDAAV
jgi:hypothetical protein